MTESLRALLSGAIDYAGLFPPASLDMETAVHNFADYRSGADAWALGRFVIPVTRLTELETVARDRLSVRPPVDEWRVSALIGSEPRAEVARVREFNRRYAAACVAIDTVEVKADSPAAARDIVREVPEDITTFVESTWSTPEGMVAELRSLGARAKVRTGGVTADAFPPVETLVLFLRACVDAGVPFKATAGLHHPLRGRYRLTYAPDSPSGLMFGFLNVLLAASLMRAGLSDGDAARMLEESSASTIVFGDSDVRWREHTLTTTQLADARASFAMSFGSCSFREPITDLMWLRLL